MRTRRQTRRLEQRRRLSVLEHVMASFAITAVVVVTVVLAMPARLSGKIEYLEVIENVLYYQVRLDDPEMRLVSDSYYLRLEHPLDRREISLEPGVQSGVIDDLRPASRYTVTLHASQGYGDEVLSRMTIDTASQPDGVIAGVFFDEAMSLGRWLVEAIIMTSALSDYSSMSVEITWWNESGFTDQVTETLEAGYNAVTLDQIWLGFTGMIRVRLMGHDTSANAIEIDAWEGIMPHALYASFYLEDIGMDTMLFSLYPDDTLTDAVYTVYLYDGSRLVEKHTFSFVTIGASYQFGSHQFSNLNSNTEYLVELWVSYTDPQSKAFMHRRIASETYQTLAWHQVQANVERDGSGYLVRLVTRDPNHVLHNIHVRVYVLSNNEKQFRGSFLTDEIGDLSRDRLEHLISVPGQVAEVMLFNVTADYAIDGVVTHYHKTIESIRYRD